VIEYPYDSLHVVRTPEGFYRVDPIPSEEELAEYYKEEYYKKNHANYKQEYTEEKIESFINKIKKRIWVLKNIFPFEPTTCLDVACGEGWGLRAFGDEGWDVTGLDFSTDACVVHNPEYAEKIITGNLYDTLDDLAGRGEKYQVLNLDNVLEHVSDPYRLLAGCRGVIEQSGVMVIEIPNSDSKHWEYLFNRGVIEWRFACMAYPDHLSYFGIDSLRNICDLYGFQEAAIVDLMSYDLRINGRPAHMDDYLDTCSFKKVLKYFASMADLGLGGEIVGYWGVKYADTEN